MCASLVLTTILLTTTTTHAAQEVASLRPRDYWCRPVPSPPLPTAIQPLLPGLCPGCQHPSSLLTRPVSLHLPSSRPQAAPHRLDSSLNCIRRHRLSGVSCSLTTLPPPHLLLTRCLGLPGAAASLSFPRPFPESGTHPGAPRGTGAAGEKTEQPLRQLLCKRCWGPRQDQDPLTLARPGSRRVSIDYGPGGHG